MIVWAIFIASFVFAWAYFILIYFYLKGWLKTPSHNTRKQDLPNSRATIVVSVRNEEENIASCIQSLLSQKIPASFYEIIVVNDFSTDNTLAEVAKIEAPNLSVYRLRDFLPAEYADIPNKKRAITLAVQKAKYDVIITADGDCIYPEYWLLSMLQYYDRTKRKLITAPIDYIRQQGFWFDFLMMDLSALIGVTAGSIAQSKPVMANGANMLFEKEAFLKVKGYEGNEHIPSGDDIFLLQKINHYYKDAVGFIKNDSAMAQTRAPRTFNEFLQQRIRWTSKSTKMADFKVKFVLVVNYLFYLLSFSTLFILPFYDITLLGAGLVILVLKTLVDFIFFSNILAFYNRTDLLKWIVPMELMHITYVTFMGVLALFGTYSWKGRKVART
jgi:cellulose synthase/poly-beta-1,6-N-acetylglucosamine synthase-like glycosyltransferase